MLRAILPKPDTSISIRLWTMLPQWNPDNACLCKHQHQIVGNASAKHLFQRTQATFCSQVLRSPRQMTGNNDLLGRTIGEFVLGEPLDEGGFGRVYRCKQPTLGREAVIKV